MKHHRTLTQNIIRRIISCINLVLLSFIVFPVAMSTSVFAYSMSVGDDVKMVASNVGVRSCKSTNCTLLGRTPIGTEGIVLDGPDAGSNYIWNRVDWDNGITGWTPNPKTHYYYYERPNTTSPGNRNHNYAIITDSTPTLRWNQVDGAVNYRIALRKEGSSSLILDRNINGTLTSYTVTTTLQKGERYYWNIAPRDADGDFGIWSYSRYFEIEDDPLPADKPSSLTPGGTNSANYGDVTPSGNLVRLRWQSSAPMFYVMFYNETNGQQSNVWISGHEYRDVTVLSDNNYSWRVKGCDANKQNCSTYANIRYFHVVNSSVPAPLTPTNLSPGNISQSSPATISGTSTRLTWQNGGYASAYKVKVYSVVPSNLIINQSGFSNQYLDINGLIKGGVYKWKVQGNNTNGNSSYSDYKYFKVADDTPQELGDFTMNATAYCEGSIPKIDFSWTESTNCSGYSLKRNIPFSDGSLVKIFSPIDRTSFTLADDLTTGETYTFHVFSFAQIGSTALYKDSNYRNITVPNCSSGVVPTPVINSIAPSTFDINDAPVTIHINGSGFTSRTKVFWNTNTNTTWRNISNTYVNNESITVNIHSFGNKARTWSLKVVNAADKYDTYSFVVTKHSQAAINTVRERIETISSDISYKDAVVITHGMNSKISAPWVKELADEICKSIDIESPTFNPNGKKNGLFLYCENDDWDVYVHDWSDAADDGATPAAAPWVWARAIYPGTTLGNQLGVKQYHYVHLIAHSAGSHVINRASMLIKLKSPNTITHLTFLDPYHPDPSDFCGDIGGASLADITYNIEHTYGKYADFTDNYFEIATLASPFSKGAWAFDTNLILKNAFNVDLTALDSICINNWSSNSSGEHGCPIWYYINTIKDSGYPYGFSFSKENTGSAPSTHLKPLLGKICVLNRDKTCGVTPYAKKCRMVQIKTSVNNTWIAGIEPLIPVQEQVESITGDVVESLSNAGRYIVDLFTGSPVWFEWTLNAEKQFNALEFDYEFHNGAEGLLTVLLDDIPIYQLDERLLSRNEKKTTQTLYFNGLEVGPHSLGFRIDPYSTQQSRATISNIKFKLIEKNIEKDHLCFPVKAKNGKIAIICI